MNSARNCGVVKIVSISKVQTEFLLGFPFHEFSMGEHITKEYDNIRPQMRHSMPTFLQIQPLSRLFKRKKAPGQLDLGI